MSRGAEARSRSSGRFHFSGKGIITAAMLLACMVVELSASTPTFFEVERARVRALVGAGLGSEPLRAEAAKPDVAFDASAGLGAQIGEGSRILAEGFSVPPPPERQLLDDTSPLKFARTTAMIGTVAGLITTALGFGSIATAALSADSAAAHRGIAIAGAGAALAGVSASVFKALGERH